MTDRPIIFSGPMVRALLEGRKTMTRRLLYVKRKAKNGIIPASASVVTGLVPAKGLRGVRRIVYEPGTGRRSPEGFPLDHGPDEYFTASGWQKVVKGDRLWVRENAQLRSVGPGRGEVCIAYQADGRMGEVFPHFLKPNEKNPFSAVSWSPSIHLPRWASRLTLVVTGTKIERVQSITMEDQIAEGLPFRPRAKAEHVMAAAIRVADELAPKWERLWRSLNGDASWEANPWVVAISFEVVRKNIDELARAA